jgi:hypothetical protein
LQLSGAPSIFLRPPFLRLLHRWRSAFSNELQAKTELASEWRLQKLFKDTQTDGEFFVFCLGQAQVEVLYVQAGGTVRMQGG